MGSENSKFDFSTITGITLAITLVLYVILSGGGNVLGFLDFKAFLIVVCGTLLVVTACFSFSDMFESFPFTFNMVMFTSVDPRNIAYELIGLAEHARRNGFLSLESYIYEKDPDSLFYKGTLLVMDNGDINLINKIFEEEMIAFNERSMKVVSILKKAAEISPAMGLIGTLIGLLQMLSNLQDVSTIGPAMAIALITTLYGAILSYMFFYPLASKVEENSNIEILKIRIHHMAFCSIVKKENPRQLEIMLNSLFASNNKINFFQKREAELS